MGHAGADLPRSQGNAAGRRCPGATDVEPAWRGLAADRRRAQVEVTPRRKFDELLVDGFFPRVRAGRQAGQPATRAFRSSGCLLRPDPAVTRYLAAFLTAHRHVAMDECEADAAHDPARPDIVLFNGGLFLSPRLRERLLDVLQSWFAGESGRDGRPLVLDNDRLDLAVARGAAYYGMVRRGQGVRIAAGLARTYYIGVETTPGDAAPVTTPNVAEGEAICLVPAGVEPGHDIDLSQRRFDLLVSEPVEFPLYYSSTRLTDRPGDLVPLDRERMTPLPPIRTVLRARKKGEAEKVSVDLHARLTEIGTLDLWCGEIAGRRSWRLQFDVRSATQTDLSAHQSAAEREGFVDEAIWRECQSLVEGAFGPEGNDKPEGLVKRLAAAVGSQRNSWPTSLCRRIWEALIEVEAGRRRSQVHEARWLNLLGFCLRPGYGLAVDDWRVAETWRIVQGKLVHPTAACRMEGWILWRRIGGGLLAGQQQALAEPLLGPVRGLHRLLMTGKGRGGDFSFPSHETAEVWRLLGSLELLPTSVKIELGGVLLDLLTKRKMETLQAAILWAIGRIGARAPLYGPLNAVVPAEAVAEWLTRLMDTSSGDAASLLAVMQMARRTDDRYRDVPEKLRDATAIWLERRQAPAHFLELVRQGGSLDRDGAGAGVRRGAAEGAEVGRQRGLSRSWPRSHQSPALP